MVDGARFFYYDAIVAASFCFALVVQRIEHGPPKPKIEVQFLSRAPKSKNASSQSRQTDPPSGGDSWREDNVGGKPKIEETKGVTFFSFPQTLYCLFLPWRTAL